MGHYLIVSTAVMDTLHFPDGRPVQTVGGGAGLYAWAGARLWNDNILLCCGKGTDFDHTLRSLFIRNSIPTRAMFSVQEPTPKTEVHYQQNGERVEQPVFGQDHYQRFVADIDQLRPFLMEAKGVYLFREVDDISFWEELFHLKKRYGFTLMWEVSADSTKPEKQKVFETIASQVDILSINKTETSNMYGTDQTENLHKLEDLKIPLVYFRQGKQGALLLSQGKQIASASDFSYPLVDPTGAGNSSSSAVLIGYCEGRPLPEIGVMGSISSGSNIIQYGIARLDSQNVFDLAKRRFAEQIYNKEILNAQQ